MPLLGNVGVRCGRASRERGRASCVRCAAWLGLLRRASLSELALAAHGARLGSASLATRVLGDESFDVGAVIGER
jgi:hypothetical protein